MQQRTERTWQVILAVFQNRRQALGDVADALWDDNPVLGQQPPDLVGLRRARLDESLPGSV